LFQIETWTCLIYMFSFNSQYVITAISEACTVLFIHWVVLYNFDFLQFWVIII
jgi:hypothetical protein